MVNRKRAGSSLYLTCLLLLISLTARGFAADSVRIKDDGDVGFATTGTWSRSTDLGYNNDILLGATSGQATWSFSVNAGEYRVSLTWPLQAAPYNKMYASAAPITVSQAGQVLLSKTVNFQVPPNDRTDASANWED